MHNGGGRAYRMRIDKIAFVDQSTTLRVCTYTPTLAHGRPPARPLEIDRSKPNVPKRCSVAGRYRPADNSSGGKLGRDQLPPPYQTALPPEQSSRGRIRLRPITISVIATRSKIPSTTSRIITSFEYVSLRQRTSRSNSFYIYSV